jgi:hypothetical protein
MVGVGAGVDTLPVSPIALHASLFHTAGNHSACKYRISIAEFDTGLRTNYAQPQALAVKVIFFDLF